MANYKEVERIESDLQQVNLPFSGFDKVGIKKIGGHSKKMVQVHKLTYKFSGDGTQDMGIVVTTDLTFQTISYKGTSTSSSALSKGLFSSANIAQMPKGVVGHIYLLKFNLTGTQPTKSQATFGWSIPNDKISREIKDVILTCNNDSDTNMYGQVVIHIGATVNFTIQPQIFDLTLMYGAGNEPTSVEQFNQDYPLPYYEFTKGAFINGVVEKVISHSKNLFNISVAQKYMASTGVGITNVTNNSITVTVYPNHPYSGGVHSNSMKLIEFAPDLKVGKQYYFSAKTQGKYNKILYLENTSRNKNIENKSINYNSTFVLKEGQLENCRVYFYGFNIPKGESAGDCVVSDIQIVEGTSPLPYENFERYVKEIPSTITSLDGYGIGINDDIYNYVDFETKTFHKKCKMVNLGALQWQYNADKNRFIGALSDSKRFGYYEMPNYLCINYEVATNQIYTDLLKNKIIASISQGYIGIIDNDYTNANDLKNSLNGVYLIYELQNEEVIDISNIIDETIKINANPNFTLEFYNYFQIDIANEVILYYELPENKIKNWKFGDIYNFYIEFNRIESYNEYCKKLLTNHNIEFESFESKTDWTTSDIVDINDLNRVKNNINIIMEALRYASPSDKLDISYEENQKWTYAEANKLEKALEKNLEEISSWYFQYAICGFHNTGQTLKIGGVK